MNQVGLQPPENGKSIQPEISPSIAFAAVNEL